MNTTITSAFGTPRDAWRDASQDALIAHRIVHIDEPVNEEVASRVIGQLLILDASGSDRPVSIAIQCPGADIAPALAIVDIMGSLSVPVRTVVIGQAAGPAALIAASGSPGQRRMMPHARLHMMPLRVNAPGDEGDSLERLREMERTELAVIDLFARATGQSPEQVRSDLTSGRIFDVDEAVAYGLVDGPADASALRG